MKAIKTKRIDSINTVRFGNIRRIEVLNSKTLRFHFNNVNYIDVITKHKDGDSHLYVKYYN